MPGNFLLFRIIKKNVIFRMSMLLLVNSFEVKAENVEFNPDFINSYGATTDLKSFNDDTNIFSGKVNAETYVNGHPVGVIRFNIEVENKKKQSYKINENYVEKIGINEDGLHKIIRSDGDNYVKISFIDFEFDKKTLTMKLSVPQMYLSKENFNYVKPGFADKGINAAFIDYSSSLNVNDAAYKKEKQFFNGISSGVNIYGWHFRHNGNYMYAEGDKKNESKYSGINTYLRKDVSALNSSLIIGQYYTPSQVFDSFSFSGAILATDDRMLPDSKLGYAPVVRGVANSNAIVTVRQSNNVIYKENVAPGPFVIDNLNGSGYSGDLNVEVEEASGEIRKFIVPFSNVPQLLREDVSKYSITFGQYNQSNLRKKPEFAQVTYQKGLTSNTSYYGGALYSQEYIAFVIGAAYASRIGGVAIDVTHSKINGDSVFSDNSHDLSGESYRITYSKALESTGTNLSLAGYKFSSENYSNFSDFASREYSYDKNATTRYSTKNKFQITLNQTLGEGFGSLFLSGSVQDYWYRGSSDSTYQGGYTNSFSWGGINISSSRTLSGNGNSDNQFMVGVSIPFGNGRNTPFFTSNFIRDDSGNSTIQNGLSGSLGEDNNLGYGLFSGVENNNNHYNHSYGGNLQFRTNKAALSGNYSRGENFRQYSLGVSGSILAFGDGVLMGPDQGETKTIIYADKAEGAAILNGTDTNIDKNGFGLLSGLRPYRKNDISLDVGSMSQSVELLNTDTVVSPAFGSVVKVKFDTDFGHPYIINLKFNKGKDLPLGSIVTDSNGNLLTQVGQSNRIYLRIKEKASKYNVSWGVGAANKCEFETKFSEADLSSDELKTVTLVCH